MGLELSYYPLTSSFTKKYDYETRGTSQRFLRSKRMAASVAKLELKYNS